MRRRVVGWMLLGLGLLILSGVWAPAVSKPVRFSAYDAQVNEILPRMTLDEKIGQMTQADEAALKDPHDIEKYFLGSVLNGGSSDPKGGNTLADWTQMYLTWQAHALSTRLKIPLLYGVDAVHGHNNVLGAVIFPHNIGLGCTRNPALVEQAARVTAEEVRATGINWSFAPCVTVPQDPRWGRTYEGFSSSPDLVKILGASAVRGLQGDDLRKPSSVLACAKHFVGDGGTSFGTGSPKGASERWPLDRGDTRIDEATLRRIHMQGFITAIQAGVGSIKASFNSWNGAKCSGDRRLLTEVLKGELGFEGFVVSDWAAIEELPGDYKSQVEESVNAGIDMVMVPARYQEFFGTLKALVLEGKVPMARIDDAVRRILRVKCAMGLMQKSWSPRIDRRLQEDFGSAAHRQVARECVRQSVVLLRNANRVLPLSKQASRIHLSGKNADDLGNQSGGWTIDWQGRSGGLTSGTTILQAIRKTVSKHTQVTFSKDGSGAAGADVAVIVIGEVPYAEMFGDREDLSLDAEDLEVIGRVGQAGVPVVLVLVSGRPMILTGVLSQADAVLAVWLPGTEGEGVADVLFGDYKPTGKLSMPWPRSISQRPTSTADEERDLLFPAGYGLSY
jgi:beta-glucosidase